MAYCCPNNGVGKFVTRGDVKADVILDQKENFIVAIFKGPLLSKSQWEKREIVMVPYNVLGKPKNSLIRVDKIWYEDVMSMRSEMFTKIERGVRLTPERRRLLFVGHGVGGAYAAIAGLTWLIERDIDRNYRSTKGDKLDIFTKVITFGAPRFGNVWLARLINKYNGTFVRFTFFNDPTPLFPPIKSGNDILSHHETELWIPMDNCDCSKIWLCEGFFKKSTFDETASSKKEGLDDNPFPEDIFFPYGYEAGENKECSSGQSIANVPPNFLHTGPYFDIVMNDCSMFDFGF
ncbi:hypothetical protein G9A89_015072 [Geosiphon pyriformis]|nr:hypothetical protein G9A89_015072 [Geosiphon pyriformis]